MTNTMFRGSTITYVPAESRDYPLSFSGFDEWWITDGPLTVDHLGRPCDQEALAFTSELEARAHVAEEEIPGDLLAAADFAEMVASHLRAVTQQGARRGG